MMDKIKCPNCGHQFDVEEALSGKLEAHFKAEYEKKIAEQAQKFNEEKRKLEAEKDVFEKKKEKENELFNERLKQKMVEESERIQKQTQELFALQLQSLTEENLKKSEENKALKRQEIELLKRENELKDKQEEMELALQKKMLDEKASIEEQARLKEREAMSMKEKEYQKKLEDQMKLIEEMKRKAEQGSMQLQGEVQELALEDLLRNTYPFDIISEVPKGVRGADTVQTVINNRQQTCGTIVYESKRTKNFAQDWIDKLKQDQITCKAEIAVLVTETLPSDMKQFGERNGVWICGFHEVKSLTYVLREMLIKMHSVELSQENKGDKMELLYGYLTSNEFVQNINRIVENYDSMFQQLNSEKRAMHKIWAMREKQIWVVQENIASLFGAIKGIAGKELAISKALELPEIDFDELE
jgi:hypothetical protein